MWVCVEEDFDAAEVEIGRVGVGHSFGLRGSDEIRC